MASYERGHIEFCATANRNCELRIFRQVGFHDEDSTYTGFEFKLSDFFVVEHPRDADKRYIRNLVTSTEELAEFFAVDDSKDNSKYCVSVLFSGRDLRKAYIAYRGDLSKSTGACSRHDPEKDRAAQNAAVIRVTDGSGFHASTEYSAWGIDTARYRNLRRPTVRRKGKYSVFWRAADKVFS